jgi:hypothetical protein
LIFGNLDGRECTQKLSSSRFPNTNCVALAFIVKGYIGAFGMVLGGKGDWIGRPGYEVCLIWGKVDESNETMGESLDTVPGGATPYLDSWTVEGGEVCAKGRPSEERFCPVLLLELSF